METNPFSFRAGRAYRIIFDNNDEIIGVYQGTKTETVTFQKKEFITDYVLFNVGTEHDDEGDFPMIGYYQARDMVSAVWIPKVRPVVGTVETLWEEFE